MFDLIQTYNLEPNLLENLKVGRIINTSEQIQYLSKIKENSFSLVIIDNVTDLFSFEFPKEEQILERNTTFIQYMHDLSSITIEKNLPIVITNMIRKIDDLEKENMEKSINLFTHIKIKLLKKGTKYFGEILPSFIQKKEFEYQITKKGLIESS
jgi:DNA repair protein RAD51